MTVAGRRFRDAETSIGAMSADVAARTLEDAADLTLVLDRNGVVQDCSFRDGGLEAELKDSGEWRGRSLIDLLTVESRPKIAVMLEAAVQERPLQLRHVNHISARGADVAIEYAAVQAGKDGPVIAFGRDLRRLSLLQQRLVDAQHAMGRDYALQRQADTRFRVLFETSPEPVILLEALSLKVVDVNPAARHLVSTGRRASGWPVTDLFAAGDRTVVQHFLSVVRNTGSADPVHVRLASRAPAPDEEAESATTLSASLLVEEPASVILVRLSQGHAAASGAFQLKERLLAAVEHAPDGFVFTDASGEVLTANSAFLTMVQLTAEDQARGRKLGVWLGQPGVDVELLITNLRQRGSVQLFGTTLRGEHAQMREVEVSAVAVAETTDPSFGFAIRDVGRRIAVAPPAAAPLPRSVEQLTELIGRVPLKDLVRDATDVIERLCIEAALELTGDNRASAAEMLGLSRQSLYVRLRRYGIGDLDESGEEG